MPAESRHPRNPRQNPAATADTLLNVMQIKPPTGFSEFHGSFRIGQRTCPGNTTGIYPTTGRSGEGRMGEDNQ